MLCASSRFSFCKQNQLKSISSFSLQDLPGALDDAAITEALELHKIKNRQWAIFKTSATKGEGLFEGLDW